MSEPEPCFICGQLPKVEDFALMVSYKRGWTALCPSKCYETSMHYDKDDAIADWNQWVESEGYVEEFDMLDDWEDE